MGTNAVVVLANTVFVPETTEAVILPQSGKYHDIVDDDDVFIVRSGNQHSMQKLP